MKLKPKMKSAFWIEKYLILKKLQLNLKRHFYISSQNHFFTFRLKIDIRVFRLKIALSEISTQNCYFHVSTRTRYFQISTQKHHFRISPQNHHFRISAQNRNFKIWTKILQNYGSQIHGQNLWWKNLRPNYLLSLLKFPNFRTRGAIG